MKYQDHHIVKEVAKNGRYQKSLISLANGDFRGIKSLDEIEPFASEAGVAVRFDPLAHPYDKKKEDQLVTFYRIEAIPKRLI